MTDTLGNVAASRRFENAPKVADIPATMTAAVDSVAGIGAAFADIDRIITLATARALIDATAKDAVAEQVIGQLMRGFTAAKLGSGPAKRATKALGKALRVAKKSDGPMKPGDALREAGEAMAYVLDHETRRRQEARKDRERKAAEKAAEKKREAAEKAAAKVEGDAEAPAPEVSVDWALYVEGAVTEIPTRDHADALVEILGVIGNLEPGELGKVLAAVRNTAHDTKREATAKIVAVG